MSAVFRPHDTLNDVINALDADLFKACFTVWVEALRDNDPEVTAIDGKTSRRSHARGKGREPLHIVSAWASPQRLVLGQETIDAKSNEITAIPLLLERLELTGAIVTIDAMGTQTGGRVNARLKLIVADLTLDREMPQDVIRRKL